MAPVVRWTATALAVLLFLSPARAQPVGPSEPVIDFRIPAQTLDAAIAAFVATSGAQVLFESRLVAGFRSSPVEARLSPEVALRTLLAGTGLRLVRAAPNAFTILPAPDPDAEAATPAAVDLGFAANLQRAVVSVLCGSERTRPGPYRAALELWVDTAGIVRRSSLVGSTGDPARDDALIAALRDLPVGAPPPPGTPQPFVLTVRQRPLREAASCATR